MGEIKKVKTAVIGCGMISNSYIRNLKKMFSIIDLAAVCDVNESAAKEKAAAYGVEKTMSIEEIAASEDIELAVNLTGPVAHYDVIKTMLLAGKHVYTEKMLTTELWQAEELLKIAEEKGLILAVAPDTVLGAGVQTAMGIMNSGLIGAPTSCLVSINRNQSLNSESFRFLQKSGGALPYDVGIYYIAAMTAVLGPVKAVRAFGKPAPEHKKQLLFTDNAEAWQIPGNNLIAASLEFESGAVASVHFDGNTIGEEKSTLRIYGTKGIMDMGDPEKFGGTVKVTLPEADEVTVPHTHGYNGSPIFPNPDMFDYAYGHRGIGVAEAAWAIRMGRPNRLSKEFGFHAMEVLCGMDEAAKTGTTYETKSRFIMKPLESGYFSTAMHGQMRSDAERSLVE